MGLQATRVGLVVLHSVAESHGVTENHDLGRALGGRRLDSPTLAELVGRRKLRDELVGMVRLHQVADERIP